MENVKEIEKLQDPSLHLPLNPKASFDSSFEFSFGFYSLSLPPWHQAPKRVVSQTSLFIIIIASIVTGGITIIIIIIITGILVTDMLFFFFFSLFLCLNLFFLFLYRVLAMMASGAARRMSWRNFCFLFFFHICSTLLSCMLGSHGSIMSCKRIFKHWRLTNIPSGQPLLSSQLINILSHLINIASLLLAHTKDCLKDSPCQTGRLHNRWITRGSRWSMGGRRSRGGGWSARARRSVRAPERTVSWRRRLRLF